VTQADIDAGVPKEPQFCPIALAARRRTSEGGAVQAYGDHISIRNIGGMHGPMWRPWLKTSRRAGQFMGRFDDGKLVSPARFRLTEIA